MGLPSRPAQQQRHTQRRQHDAEASAAVIQTQQKTAKRAASRPPVLKTRALATPASRRCASKGADAVKKPLAAMNSVASTEPQSSTRVGALRRTSHDMASAPIK
jgi:type II secretory pathway pseudopilin PulG